ncbi:hypothetical protein [Roseofilum casamattae]|uniref:SCP-2 sterol transfer family protein n=1 Tax=Roseofilum casamattae BLCC-M143 TaxID=3022442 RepID=A0ABT7BR04_9CYAN|nr:hypothetical protein [Roseofilum casamattae]MDJ1181633.1 SCP-2 sterol transfer family protein [Roseofilum casamattae BLCC-M143]
MADLFSQEWMESYMKEWNKEPELADALARIGFNAIIGYGFIGEDHPTGIITVVDGTAASAGIYEMEKELTWDLRASEENWVKWLQNGLGMASLGAAYVGGKLKFELGDYSQIIKDPRIAGPFVKSFAVMGRI